MRLETDQDGNPIVVPGTNTTGRNPAVFAVPPAVPVAGDLLNTIRSDGQVTPQVFVPFTSVGGALAARSQGQANGGQWVPLAGSPEIEVWNPLQTFPATSVVLVNEQDHATLWVATAEIAAGQPRPGQPGAPAEWMPVNPSPSVVGGFTFVSATMPTPTRQGDTWWDENSGTSFVALTVDDAGSLRWVQFAPGAGGGDGGGGVPVDLDITGTIYQVAIPPTAGISPGVEWANQNLVPVPMKAGQVAVAVMDVKYSLQAAGLGPSMILTVAGGAEIAVNRPGPAQTGDFGFQQQVVGMWRAPSDGTWGFGYRLTEWWGSNWTVHSGSLIRVTVADPLTVPGGGGGGGADVEPVACRARATDGTWTGPSTWNKVALTTLLANSGGWTLASGGLVVPETGFYSLAVRYNQAGRLPLLVAIDGIDGTYAQFTSWWQNDESVEGPVLAALGPRIVQLAAGFKIEPYVLLRSGASVVGNLEVSIHKIGGPQGPQGDPGAGVPAGGARHQVLAKTSADDREVAWATIPFVQHGTTVQTSDSGGNITITYPEAFAAAPTLLVNLTFDGIQFFAVPPDRGNAAQATPSQATVVIRRHSDRAAQPGVTVRVDWIAVGTRVTT